MFTIFKKVCVTIIVAFVIVSCSNNDNKVAEEKKTDEICYNPNQVIDTSKKSIKSMAFAVVNDDSVKINYHSPGVRKRIIWGGLVPFDEVWVTGAHDATTLEIAMPIIVEGVEIPAGKYALFTIPGVDEWTVIINTKWKQHLASEYEEKDDVVRIKVKPIEIEHLERLQYYIKEEISGISIAVAWEKVKVSFTAEFK